MEGKGRGMERWDKEDRPSVMGKFLNQIPRWVLEPNSSGWTLGLTQNASLKVAPPKSWGSRGIYTPTRLIIDWRLLEAWDKSRFSSISNLPQGRWAGFCRERKCSDNKTGASSWNGDQRCTEMAGPRGCGRSATTVCYNPRFLRCGPQMGKSQAKWRQTRFFTSGCLLTNESALVNFQELNYTLTILTVYLPRFFFPLESYLLVSHWTSVLSRAEFEKCCHNCLLINTEKWIRQILMAADQRHPHLFNVFDKRVTSNFSFQLWS